MNNSIGHGVLNQTLLGPSVTEYQSRMSTYGISAISLYRPVCGSGNQVLGQPRKLLLSTPEFCRNNLGLRKPKLTMGKQLSRIMIPHAVLTTDPAYEVSGKFNLGKNIELQIGVITSASGLTQVDFKISYTSDTLQLHWGVIKDRNGKWVLPSRHPDGTNVYKDKALRTPFVKSGSGSVLKIEINDPAIQAIEFLIVDEARNKWFKDNGENFCVKLPKRHENIASISVPEDLVQIQAYLRWERKGKQMYTPEKQKEEYEAARIELMEEIAGGSSLEDIRAKLTKSTSTSETKDLLVELDKGTSVDEIRKKVTKGEIATKVEKQLTNKKNVRVQKIERKKRDLMQLINRHKGHDIGEHIAEQASSTGEVLSAIGLFAKEKEEENGGVVLNKKIFKLGENELLVLVTKPGNRTKVYLATDFKMPIILHWALSKSKSGEWLAPPPSAMPSGSIALESASETHFVKTSLTGSPYELQSLVIEIEDDSFKGLPFVLLSGENWIKNNGSNFYVEFAGRPKQAQKDSGDGKGTAKTLLNQIAEKEEEAQKSFMHRFNIAADLVDQANHSGLLGFAALFVWMRFMATRQLIWNKNYNVKPREISQAQDRLTGLLQNVYISYPQYRELLRMILATVGRGGEGDVGQRIRDEILVIQRKNDCKGGMMEEWHQKLHNNTSPDDIFICQALIDYIKSDFDIGVYWKTLKDNGITKERLLSYDRAIHSEPNFRRDQKDGLLRDLGNYMRTLKAVHSGADLESAISNCIGYKTEGQGFMVGVNVNTIPGLPSGFPGLLEFVLEHVEDKNVEYLVEGLLEARQELLPLLSKSQNRLKDLLFLDIALDSTVRTAVERGYEELNDASPEKIMYFISMVLENLALSSDENEDLICCLKGWGVASSMSQSNDRDWALYAKSVLDRTRLALANKAERYQQILQPSAEYLGSLLGVDRWAVEIFTEEVIRAGSAASLSALLNRLDPILRKTANLGSWQVISPVEVVGHVEVVDELLTVQNKSYDRPTILVAKSVKGEEEIPDGTVAVLTPDMPDVLSHVSVRARNSKVCFATCFDSNILADLQAQKGKLLHLKPTSADVIYREVKGDETADVKTTPSLDGPAPPISLVRKTFAGRYAISSEEFTSEMVGAKSRNISYLKGKVPSWIGIPTSVALPFGVFERILEDDSNKAVAQKLEGLKKKLVGGDFHALQEIRETVLQLKASPQLVQELKNKMKSSGMPWPGDEGEQRWEQAWTAIKKVWGSKWNERAYLSTRKVKLDHDFISMAVLVQEVVNADYAFVIHTTNPSSGDSSEIYAEVVKGLGETLVGAYPGRALSFVCKKNDLNSPRVVGYPSKPIGLFIRRSIIFRSDSNGEDLEGYAGAGLYDSVPMDEEEKIVLDYSGDPLVVDGGFRRSILSSIAQAGNSIEQLYGSPQDIEGVIRDGKVFVVQTRPQIMPTSSTENLTLRNTANNCKQFLRCKSFQDGGGCDDLLEVWGAIRDLRSENSNLMARMDEFRSESNSVKRKVMECAEEICRQKSELTKLKATVDKKNRDNHCQTLQGGQYRSTFSKMLAMFASATVVAFMLSMAMAEDHVHV